MRVVIGDAITRMSTERGSGTVSFVTHPVLPCRERTVVDEDTGGHGWCDRVARGRGRRVSACSSRPMVWRWPVVFALAVVLIGVTVGLGVLLGELAGASAGAAGMG